MKTEEQKELSRYELIEILKREYPGNAPASWSRLSTKRLRELYQSEVVNREEQSS